jgi:hypothetical protein
VRQQGEPHSCSRGQGCSFLRTPLIDRAACTRVPEKLTCVQIAHVETYPGHCSVQSRIFRMHFPNIQFLGITKTLATCSMAYSACHLGRLWIKFTTSLIMRADICPCSRPFAPAASVGAMVGSVQPYILHSHHMMPLASPAPARPRWCFPGPPCWSAARYLRMGPPVQQPHG